VNATYQRQRAWSDSLLGEARMLVGYCTVSAADYDDDTQRATDLRWLNTSGAQSARVACRLRDHSYFLRYPGEFTIRSHSNGRATELDKIMSGHGTHALYGFRSEDGEHIGAWSFLDLFVFRGWFFSAQQQFLQGRARKMWSEQDNGDGTRFYAFKYDDLPTGLVLFRGTGMQVCDNAQMDLGF
jgi:hypothetical protein